jgi:hypothetical protein
MNRCIAYNKNNKKCRAKIENNKLVCCDAHLPINKEIITEGCFICFEKMTNTTDLVYLRCCHAFHKDCYAEWLHYSTYDTAVCILCLNEVFTSKNDENDKKMNEKILEKLKKNNDKIEILNKINKIIVF